MGAIASLQGMRILAVDDMLESLEPFAELLRIGGADVDIASSGEEALAKLDADPYDLLISDLGMDEMDGYELIYQVRQRPLLKSLKAIALSGYGRQVDVDRALRSGFNCHLSKPASVADIRRAIAQLSSGV
jgi:two-component system CheB/CheR fusion protein